MSDPLVITNRLGNDDSPFCPTGAFPDRQANRFFHPILHRRIAMKTGTKILLAALTASAALAGSASAAIINVVDADNVLPAGVTSISYPVGQYNRDMTNVYDQEIDDAGDGTSNVIMDPDTLDSGAYKFYVVLDAAYDLSELRAYTSRSTGAISDRKSSSVQFEVSIDGGSNWTDAGTVASSSFIIDPDFGTGTEVAVVTGSFADVNAIRFSFVAASGLNPRVTEVMALVPEPGSLALLAMGGLCVLRRRRG